jgi:hypothetical protein
MWHLLSAQVGNHFADNGGRSVGIVRSWTQTMEFSFFICLLISILIYGVIWKVASDKLLTKQGMRRKIIIHKYSYVYILKQLLNTITSGTVELDVSGNMFLYVCVKDICCLWSQLCFDTFHQLLIIVEVLWSQPILQVGKQLVVALSKIRAVRRVVQQCSNASNYMPTHTVMEEH